MAIRGWFFPFLCSSHSSTDTKDSALLTLFSGVGVISRIGDCLVLQEHASLLENENMKNEKTTKQYIIFFKVYYLFSYITALIRETWQIHFATRTRKNMHKQTTAYFYENARSTNLVVTQPNCVKSIQHNPRFKSWCR